MKGPFVILTFTSPTDPPMVYLETATDGLYLDEPADVERYTPLARALVACRASAWRRTKVRAALSGSAGTIGTV